jgi:hypothetical protein
MWRPSGMTVCSAVGSSPPVSWTGKRCGPSMRHTWLVPVTDQLKNSRDPSGASWPAPGERTSNMAWTLRRRSGGSSGAA